MQPLLILNGKVITGDGTTVLETSTVIIEGQRIADVLERRPDTALLDSASRVIDAEGKLVFPGIINGHTHGTTLAPMFASGAPPLGQEQVLRNLDEHLLEGTTTLLSVDGFATMEDAVSIDRLHPVRVRTATCHTPWNLKAADDVDASGMREGHRQVTAEGMLAAGAVAIGEVGAGHTLGGGGQDYYYIPMAVKRETGREITERQARGMKRAVLGRYVDPSAYDQAAVVEALQAAGLTDCLTPEEARALIVSTVVPPVNAALEGLREAASYAQEYGVPAIVHNSAPSKKVIREIAEGGLGQQLIAAHSNHTTFTLDEGIEHAQKLRERGTIIDLCTYGSFKAGDADEMEMQFALLGEGLVDTVSTDYGGGIHDPMLLVLEMAVGRGLIGLAEAIALVTGNVAQAIPKLAPNRGWIARGREADLVIADRENFSCIDMILIGGQIVVQDGRRSPRERGELARKA